MYIKHLFPKLLLLLLFYSIFFGCARRGRPTGGVKDTIPPVLIKTIPAMESINFKEDKIKIYFDEYIKLKDVKKNLIVSPPQKTDAIITPVGTASKLITIKILDTLDANTTYSFNFGNSIIDNNEGNKLGNFKYVFSTGSYIDSLYVKGEVTDPIIKEITKGIDVMLYEYNASFTDSVIYKEKPRYIANTLDSTLFNLTNLRAGKYLLIALKDANNNKIYNPEIDKIGFVKDTITIPTNKTFNFPIFKEIPKLKVFNPREVSKGHLIFGFEGDAKNLNIELLTETSANFISEIVFEKDKDTINYWYTPIEIDSLNFIVSKGKYSEKFTLKIRSSKTDSLKIENNTGRVLHLRDTFSIASNIPIAAINKPLMQLIDKDSVAVDFNAILSKNKSKLYINFNKQYNMQYHLELLPKAIIPIFGASNDSISYKFRTKALEDYGTITITVASAKKTAFIIELLDKKNTVVRISKIEEPKEISFKLLPPGDYMVRITVDKNNNGIWDTGSFLNKQQPEIIKYFKKKIELRANWDVNETFNLD